MNIDPILDQALSALPYPVGKDNLIQVAKQFGANDQIVGLLGNLPDMEFNSPEEVKNMLGAFGNLSNFGGLGDLFKR